MHSDSSSNGKSINDGKDFENYVQKTLRLKGYEVEPEQLIGTKKVDLLVTEQRWGLPWRIAVECKDESRPMSKKGLAGLWAEYSEIYDTHTVNEILIVTRVPPSPAALTWARNKPGLSVQTLAEINRNVFDMSEYLRVMARAFRDSQDGLAEFYQEPTTSSGHNLSTMIDEWITSSPESSPESSLNPSKPVAILGAYGIGKTSFASHLASRLAEKARFDINARIPILIPLGDLAGEQSLQGLLGAHLASAYEIPGYSYSKFREMNRNGRFVVILDGFDEMKHLITWSEFLYNISQLVQLSEGDSRVVLLGRPTAFETDQEKAEALGCDNSLIEIGYTARNFQEIEMAQFSPGQVKNFISEYFKHLERKNGKELQEMAERVQEIVDLPQFQDIASRPVHLGMLALVLPAYTGKLENLDLPLLYELVIDDLITKIISRETEKGSRLGYEPEDRRDFLQQLAYWMWTRAGGYVVSSDEISDSIIEPFAKGGAKLPRVRRELVMGAPLERKGGEKLRFPHRSFQEYLVAAECLRRIRSKLLDIQEYDNLVTDEVAAFVRSARTPDDVLAARVLVNDYRGTLSWRTIHSLFLEDACDFLPGPNMESMDHQSLWSLLLKNVRVVESPNQYSLDEYSIKNALNASNPEDVETPLMALFLVLVSNGGKRVSEKGLSLLETTLNALIRRGPIERFDRASLKAMGERRTIAQKYHRRPASRLAELSPENRNLAASDNRIRLALIPLGENYIGDLREGTNRIGLRISGGRLTRPVEGSNKLDIAGGTTLNVRWLSSASISACAALRSDGRFDGRAMIPSIISGLESSAFVSDWRKNMSFTSSLKLPPPIPVSKDLARAMYDVTSARLNYSTERENRATQ